MQELFWINAGFIALLAVAALYCVVVSRNMIRVLIGIELLTKAVTLLIAAAGAASDRMALAQTFIITLILIEVVVIAVMAGIVIGVHRHSRTLDIRSLRKLKG